MSHGHTTDRCDVCASARRGSVLLELTLALALFVAAAIAVLGAVSRSASATERTADRLAALELAQTAAVLIESGQAREGTLDGEIPTASTEDASSDDPRAIASLRAPAPGWVLTSRIEPTEFNGLSLLAVTVGPDGFGDRTVTIRRLFHPSDAPIEEADTDDLADLFADPSTAPTNPAGRR